MTKRIIYIARNDSKTYPGVKNKIEQTVFALKKIGFDAEMQEIAPNPKHRSIVEFIKSVTKNSADVLILRSDILLMPLLMLPLLWRRLGGCKIIVDVPTPFTVVLQEIKSDTNVGRLKKVIRQTFTILAFPWSLWPSNKVIQYAIESEYFSIGLKRKTQLMANGIDVEKTPQRKKIPHWPAGDFVLIGVASLADWHAFDRVIKGIASYMKKSQNSFTKPKFIIVGDGAIRNQWEQLADDLGVRQQVIFVGYQTGIALGDLFEKAHVAVASLGLYRINLEVASVLKSREYAARGIPFVSSGQDIDFEPKPDFVFKIENNSVELDIEKVIRWYDEYLKRQKPFDDIRSFAKMKLDYSSKITSILT